mgnify:CR=1 FL=1
MFDVGFSELVVIFVLALLVLGPERLPRVASQIGQWAGKARRMAAEFQGQFNEAMREAEMADIKKQFDDVSSAARDLSPTNLLASVSTDIEEAMKIEPVMPTTPEPPTAATFAEAEAHQPAPEPATPPPSLPDAKAS